METVDSPAPDAPPMTAASSAFRSATTQSELAGLRDGDGVYALIGDDEVIVAKQSLYRGMATAHTDAVRTAEQQGKVLLFYVHDDGDWYEFDPSAVLANYAFTNDRFDGKAGEMLNWDVGMGRRIDI